MCVVFFLRIAALSCCRVDDPIITQSLLSFSLTSEDHWKLESWKVLFAAASVVYSDFSFTLNEVKLRAVEHRFISLTQTDAL